MRRTLIFFDFWGAGNIGDDLMMDGFLRSLDQLGVDYRGRLSCLCANDIESQRARFPSVQWLDSKKAADRQSALAEAELILGIGGTPFQLTCGDWFLRYLKDTLKEIQPAAEILFINIGAEREIMPAANDFATILSRVSRCSVRDLFSQSVLNRLPVKITTFSPGGDLANTSLEHLTETKKPGKKFSLGVILGFDTLSEHDLNETKKFLNEAHGPIQFITGDCREGAGFEYDLFKQWTESKTSLLKKKLILRRPDYGTCSLAELIQPIGECETILSSRLHGLLTAAWLGCRVAALGRSSKVVALAKALDIPYIEPPFESWAMHILQKRAVTIHRERLMEHKEMCLKGISACKFW